MLATTIAKVPFCSPTSINQHLNVSFEDLNEVMKDAKKLKVPFGFKINAFEHIPPGWKPDSNNPKVQLGKRKDLTPQKFLEICKKLKSKGANIIGGCCEITPKHIKYLSSLK